MLGRAAIGKAMFSISPDRGTSWTKGQATNLATSFVSVYLKKVDSDLYAFYNKGPTRQNLTMARLVSPNNFGIYHDVLTFTG